jgi:hypothetical protein
MRAAMRKLKIDQPEIVNIEPLVRPSALSRYVCLSHLDWKLFATALVEAFPDALYNRHLTIKEAIGAEQPEVRLVRSPWHPDLIYPIEMHFDPATRLNVEKGVRWLITVKGQSWPQIRLGGPVPPKPADAHGPEHIGEGQIQIHLAPNHKGHARFARQIYRLLAQFTTNERQTLVGYPHYEVIPEPPGPPLFGLWIGHDALRWAREDSKRLLAYERSSMSTRTPDNLGYGYRPK